MENGKRNLWRAGIREVKIEVIGNIEKGGGLLDLQQLMDLFESQHKIATMNLQNTQMQKVELAYMMLVAKQNQLILEKLNELLKK